MIRISASPADPPYPLPVSRIGELIAAIGTDEYDAKCLDTLSQSFEADHWTLFHYRAAGRVDRIASASRRHAAAAEANVRQFLERCHRVDPSLVEIRSRCVEPACIVQMQPGDILDRQYRRCFELTRVKERISFFSRAAGDLYQLSIYRGTRHRPLGPPELERFAALASVIVSSGAKHEWLVCTSPRGVIRFDIESMERRFRQAPFGLSQRESEVCARAAAGRTIDETAAELRIGRTSIITYRQRAYQKLEISRQSELVALLSQPSSGAATAPHRY